MQPVDFQLVIGVQGFEQLGFQRHAGQRRLFDLGQGPPGFIVLAKIGVVIFSCSTLTCWNSVVTSESKSISSRSDWAAANLRRVKLASSLYGPMSGGARCRGCKSLP